MPQTPASPADSTEKSGKLRRIEQQKKIVSEVVSAVSAVTGVSTLAILSHRRPADYAYARMLVYYFAVEKFCVSLPLVGKCLDRDHTTVLYGYRKIADSKCRDVRQDVEIIDAALDRLGLA